MVNKVSLVTLLIDLLFLASGAVELVFSLVVRAQMNDTPTSGTQATRNLLYQQFPLVPAIANGGLIAATALATLLGLLLPAARGWLKMSGYLILACGVFTLCIGLDLWISTLQIKAQFFGTYVDQDSSVQDLIQTSFKCCGYFNSTSPAFVTDSTCPSPAAAALLSGCASSISTFANVFIDNIFTALFGIVGTDALLILSIMCVLKDRKEHERYRHIDQKSGYRQI